MKMKDLILLIFSIALINTSCLNIRKTEIYVNSVADNGSEIVELKKSDYSVNSINCFEISNHHILKLLDSAIQSPSMQRELVFRKNEELTLIEEHNIPKAIVEKYHKEIFENFNDSLAIINQRTFYVNWEFIKNSSLISIEPLNMTVPITKNVNSFITINTNYVFFDSLGLRNQNIEVERCKEILKILSNPPRSDDFTRIYHQFLL